jgi:hypothetical protein
MTDAPQKDGGQQALQSNVVKFLEDQIDKLRTTAPEWVRAIVYFMFSAAFVVIVFRVTAGEYIVAGHIDVISSDGSVQQAVGYEVAANHVYYGVNSNGDFFAVLSLRKFLSVLWFGEFETQVIHDHISQVHIFEYGRWDGDFHNSPVKIDTTFTTDDRDGRSSTPKSDFLALLPEAYAAQPPMTMDRLVVDSVRLGELTDTAKVHLTAYYGSFKARLQYVGSDAELSMSGNRIRQLGNDYYFVVPGQSAGLINVLDSGYLGFHSVSEQFSVPPGKHSYNKRFKLHSKEGGEIWVRWMTPYDLVLFSRNDIAARLSAITADLQRIGINVVLADAPLGDAFKTNVLFLGRSIPLSVAQSIIAILTRHQVPLAVVRRNVAFKKGTDLQIEVGAQQDLQGVPPLNASQIDKLLAAKTDMEFAIAGAE